MSALESADWYWLIFELKAGLLRKVCVWRNSVKELSCPITFRSVSVYVLFEPMRMRISWILNKTIILSQLEKNWKNCVLWNGSRKGVENGRTEVPVSVKIFYFKKKCRVNQVILLYKNGSVQHNTISYNKVKKSNTTSLCPVSK